MGGTGCFEANVGEIVVVLRASHDACHRDARHAGERRYLEREKACKGWFHQAGVLK